MRAQRHYHVDLGANPFDQAFNLGQIAGHVECAIHRTQDVHARFRTLFSLFLGWHTAFGHAKFRENPRHGPICRLPLIFINCTRKEPLNCCSLWRNATANHLGNRTSYNDRRQSRIQGFPCTLHCPLCPVTTQFFFAKASGHNGQFMWGQRVSIVQDRCNRQIFAPNRAINNNLKPLNCAKRIDGSPISTRTIMI